MPDVLAASDVCVATLKNIPMFTTTYPNKVFDYMAAGRPTVLCIDGVIRQVIEAAGGGIFSPPGDPQSLAAAVQKLHGDRSAARQMGLRGRQYVERHFHRHRQADHFAELMLRLSSGNFTSPVDSQQEHDSPNGTPPMCQNNSDMPFIASIESAQMAISSASSPAEKQAD